MFPGVRLAVLIDGCFWHGCLEHHTVAQRNASYWAAKVTENRRRDEETSALWSDAGWTVMRFWEHQSAEEVAEAIEHQVQILRENRRLPPLAGL